MADQSPRHRRACCCASCITRYGRNNIGFLWLFVEPMLFTLAITAFWAATRSVHGSDIPIVAFALTGYSSMMMWRNLPNRCIGALKSNKPLLYHRQVRIIDVYMARIILEIIGASTSFVVLALAFYAMDWLAPPEDALQVVERWLLLGWFGAGPRTDDRRLFGAARDRRQAVAALFLLLFPLSGVAFIVDALPPRMQEIVLWLPMLNALGIFARGLVRICVPGAL